MSSWLVDSDDELPAGLSFLERARAAPEDDDDVPMTDARELDLGDDGGEETQLQRLIRHWTNERHAPDVLPGQEDLLGGLLDHIRRQTETVQLLRADPDSSEDEHFRIMLAQTEIERVKFVVRSYVRTRLAKIEKFARWIVANPEIQDRLSQTELNHARTYARLVETHFHFSILQSLPEQQRTLDDTTAFMPSMVTEPDKSRAVFVHAREDCPPVRLPDGDPLEMKKDQIVLTPYIVIEQLLLRGEVELV